jgi:hypothetical protein
MNPYKPHAISVKGCRRAWCSCGWTCIISVPRNALGAASRRDKRIRQHFADIEAWQLRLAAKRERFLEAAIFTAA